MKNEKYNMIHCSICGKNHPLDESCITKNVDTSSTEKVFSVSVRRAKIIKQWESLKTDKERWTYIVKNQDKGITIYLDNDDTYGVFENERNSEDPYIFQFDNYIGWSEGVGYLLNILNIKWDYV